MTAQIQTRDEQILLGFRQRSQEIHEIGMIF